MKLSDLIFDCRPPITRELPQGLSGDLQVSGITSDSRDVIEGSVFVAIEGFEADGHNFIDPAFEKGACAVIAQKAGSHPDRTIRVKDTRLAAALLADRFYGKPSKDMTLVGITGTNGKTTTSWILESIFNRCGFSTGVIGTVNVRFGGKVFDAPVTTPDAMQLQKTLAEMKAAGVTHVIMEVSSHGLDLKRVDGCRFDAGIFTNLTQDHMDHHRDMDAYFDAKKRLFTQFLGTNHPKAGAAIINLDNDYGQALVRQLSYPAVTVSTKKPADFSAQDISDRITGISARILYPEGQFKISSALAGRFNLENILCAAAAAHYLKIEPGMIKKGIESCPNVPGRLEKVSPDFDRHLFVDYAHTPDALKSTLKTLKDRAPKRLITVFGCGGDRDRAKRPLMGEMACRYSDITIITSDNPRSEAPEDIIKDIIAGTSAFPRLKLPEEGSFFPERQGYLVEPDRKKALFSAVDISLPGDILVAAGKGHETYQITNSGTIHFDDTEVLGTAVENFKERFRPLPWTAADICRALECEMPDCHDQTQKKFSGISTDSRTIQKDQVFVALKGETFDGHVFIQDLVDKGVTAFIVHDDYLDFFKPGVQKEFLEKGLLFFKTRDTLEALGRLGRFQRLRTNVNVLAITGSSGKTTTRKISQLVFGTRYHTLATTGNLNNEIGVPLTLLNLSSAHEWAIIEMGMNHAGEMSRLSHIACPDIAMIMNTAGVHLEGLGSVENVAKAKAEIFDGMQKGGIAILPASDPRREILEKAARSNSNIETIRFFGNGSKTDLQAESIQPEETGIRFTTGKHGDETFFIPSPGLFMVDNCLGTILAADCAKISTSGIQKGLASYRPVIGRMNIFKLPGGITLIDDTYNANPSSVNRALETLEKLSSGNTSIAVLGDMLELGETSEQLHRKIGEKISTMKISYLFTHGPLSCNTIKGAVDKGFAEDHTYNGEKSDIAKLILDTAGPGCWILVKGSRGMAMETVVQTLKGENHE